MCITLTETQHHSLWPTTIQLKLAQHYQNYGSTLVTQGDLFHYYQYKRLFVSIITKLISAFNLFIIHFFGSNFISINLHRYVRNILYFNNILAFIELISLQNLILNLTFIHPASLDLQSVLVIQTM